MKGLFCFLILFAASAGLAQNPSPTAQPPEPYPIKPEPYHIKNDVLGEPISVYRQNNPECSDKDPITGSANFYQAKTTGKWSGTCMALSFDPELPAGKSTPITYADISMKARVASFSEDRWVWLIFTAKHPDYDFLRNNLIAKFGEPTGRATEDVQNRMAVHFVGELLTWDNGVSSIHLEEYGDDLDSSSLVFALDDYLKQQKPLSKSSPDV
jgi:hypothetical protein